MRNEKITFQKLARQNTGSSFLDSSGAYGRHWQKPLETGLIKLNKSTFRDQLEFDAYINLPEFLTKTLEIDHEMTNKLRKLQEKNEDGYYVDSAAELLSKELGWKYDGKPDNAYNHENDLNQVFQYAIIIGPDESDWLYADDCYVLIETHNGCDVRGGYSDVVVCKPVNGYDGNYDFLEWTIGWNLVKGKSKDGKKLNREDLESLGQEFECGYSNNPSYRFNEAIEKVISVNPEKLEVVVILKSGETVMAYPTCRAEYL